MKKALFLLLLSLPLYANISYYFSNPLAQALRPISDLSLLDKNDWFLKVIEIKCLKVSVLYNKNQWKEIHYNYSVNPYKQEEIIFNSFAEKKTRVWEKGILMEERVEKNGEEIYYISFRERNINYRPDGCIRSLSLADETYRFQQNDALLILVPQKLLKWQWTPEGIKKLVLTQKGNRKGEEWLTLKTNGSLYRMLEDKNGYQEFLYSHQARLLVHHIYQAGKTIKKDNWLYDKQGNLLYWKNEENSKLKEHIYEWKQDELQKETIKENHKIVQITDYSPQEKFIQRFNNKGEKIGEFTLQREKQ